MSDARDMRPSGMFGGAAPGELSGVDAVLADAGVKTLPRARRVVMVGNKLSPGWGRGFDSLRPLQYSAKINFRFGPDFRARRGRTSAYSQPTDGGLPCVAELRELADF